MKIISQYESVSSNGNTPVLFIDGEESELETLVHASGNPETIKVINYEDILEQIAEKMEIQIHYLHVDGQVFRIFIGKSEFGDYGLIKSTIKVGNVLPQEFEAIVPKKCGLTESQVNRSIRQLLKKYSNVILYVPNQKH